MRIRNILHKGLRRLYDADQTKGVPAAAADKLRKMLFFLESIGAESELRARSVWKPHQLSGERKGTWSLHLTANWRLTFEIEGDEICNVNLEDYH